MAKVAIFGYRGFFGSALHAAAEGRCGWEVSLVDRRNFEQTLSETSGFDVVINAAMPSARFWAENNPVRDFEETVAKTMKIAAAFPMSKFVQISTVSARLQLDTVYGRNKLAAECLLDPARHLIFRLGPLYGAALQKGVILDIVGDADVYVSGDTRYAFTPVDWLAGVVLDNLDLKGVHEIGAQGSVVLEEMARDLGSRSRFVGDKDDQVFETVHDGAPDASDVLEFARALKTGEIR